MTGGVDPTTDNDLIADGTTIRSQYDMLDKPLSGEMPDPGDMFDKGSSAAGWAGGTFLASSFNIANDIESGNWVQVGVGGAGVGLTALDAGMDPIGFIASQLFGWMLEHLEPLRAALHGLTGSPAMVKAYSSSWENIETELASIADDYKSAAQSTSRDWRGEGAEAYRGKAADIVGHTQSISNAARAMKTASAMMAEVVGAIRSAVRDVLAGLAGSLVSYALELAGTLGVAAPYVIEQAIAEIAKDGAKIARLVARVVQTVSQLSPLLGVLKNLLTGLLQEIEVA